MTSEPPSLPDFEKLGSFYLGREYDMQAGSLKPDLLLYDAKDLTTHAVCVGMTGSGKTGLCLTLLEEAAIDAIPAIAIDPKGDLSNLLLTFPELRPEDFRPWIDPNEAARRGLAPDRFAHETANQWREGLAAWGQDGARIRRLRESVDLSLYTPGSSAGRPLAVLRSFAAPTAALRGDADAMRDRVLTAASALLSLVGIDADPVRSREHILLASLLQKSWGEGRDLDMAELLRQVQQPPLEKVGFLDLETFYPSKDRADLALRLNSLAASPAFAAWLEGEPLDIGRLLYTAEGRPRLSILSIAHLSDPERMFFVTLLLSEVVAWMRNQPGTASLRAILYMDEVFGYFPPTANPPSKMPMLTLLKQARAYGLGVVLATQNPVDLDYKGLSNTGTWFLGRLQTERDKARVMDGLEGAAAGAVAKFNRAKMESLLAGLGNRVFLMNNVHEDEPVVFQTRWALSYLRGPLTRPQIQDLAAPPQPQSEQAGKSPAPPTADTVAVDTIASPPLASAGERPLVPVEAGECFLPPSRAVAGTPIVYQPTLLGVCRVHFVDRKHGVDVWRTVVLQATGESLTAEAVWENAERLDDVPPVEDEPAAAASFVPLPADMARPKSYGGWEKSLRNHLFRSEKLTLWNSPAAKLTSTPGESEAEFRIRLRQAGREQRDREVEKLRDRYASKSATLRERLRRAEEKVDREKSQFVQRSLDTAISLGTSVLGAFVGRKLFSRTNLSRAASTAKGVGRSAREREDISLAQDTLEAIRKELDELEAGFRAEVDEIDRQTRQNDEELRQVLIGCRKSDLEAIRMALAWQPHGD